MLDWFVIVIWVAGASRYRKRGRTWLDALSWPLGLGYRLAAIAETGEL